MAPYSSFHGFSDKELQWIITHKKDLYHSFSRPKRSGGKRIIDAPQDPLKTLQRKIYRQRLYQHDPKLSVHALGYRPKKSIWHHAKVHSEAKTLLRIDIEDFFPSILESQVRQSLLNIGFGNEMSSLIASLSSNDGSLPQGAPTSPFLSNLVFTQIDKRIHRRVQALNEDIAYSRWADDLSFSIESPRYSFKSVIEVVNDELRRGGFKINHRKTKIMGLASRRMVCGMTISGHKKYPTNGIGVGRKKKRFYRAVAHQCIAYDDKKKWPKLQGYLSHLKDVDQVGYEQLITFCDKTFSRRLLETPTLLTRELQRRYSSLLLSLP